MMSGSRIVTRCASLAATITLVVLTVAPVPPAFAANYFPISGAGSTWSANAINQWITDVDANGAVVQYASTGSSDGRHQFQNQTVDFAASDIPFQFHPEDGSQPETPPPYAYTPVTAGGTVFMYNLTIGGQRVTNLRLSGSNIAKIFTGGLKKWNDPLLVADNPQLALPDRTIVPVVRSDGSGSTAQFTLWLIAQHNDLWAPYCHATGRSACGETSYYPTAAGMVAQAGDLGVASYVAQNYSDGAIGYVNYSYALNAGFPVAKMLNAAGYYTEPTAQNVAVSLLKAKINTDATSPDYLTQQLDGVYTDTDPRNYQLSSYSYLILPTSSSFSADKGKTLAFFTHYSLCEGQNESANLGYSPLPVNLVQAGFDQIKKVHVPAGYVQDTDITKCHNPTITTDGSNALANTAPQPQACDKQGSTQCATGTGGAKNKSTALSPPAAGGTPKSSGVAGNNNNPAAPTSNTSTGGNSNTTATTVGPGATSQAACNSDSGGCPAAPISGDSTGGAAQVAAATALLAVPKGWTGTQTLLVVAGLFTFALVLAPGLVLHYLTKRRRP